MLKATVGLYESGTEADYLACHLPFAFAPGAVPVSTAAGVERCGFGNGIQADRTYYLQNKAIPAYFLNGEGDTIAFQGLTPESY